MALHSVNHMIFIVCNFKQKQTVVPVVIKQTDRKINITYLYIVESMIFFKKSISEEVCFDPIT